MATRKDRRKETQRQQEAAVGLTVSPRRLARSIAKYYGGGHIDEDWKQRIRRLPKTGRKYLHPERHRVIRDCSGEVGGQV